MKAKKVLVIDGQGGKMGAAIVEQLKASGGSIEITAVGTNTAATAAMLKAGADHGATGENPAVVCCRTAEYIVGPVGIIVADSLLGEVSPKMAVAVGQSPARRVLIPVNLCNTHIAGTRDMSLGEYVKAALREVLES